jgi:hypothetical protein
LKLSLRKYLPQFAVIAALSLSFNASIQAVVLAESTFDESSFASSDASTSWTTSDISSGEGGPMTISGTEGNPAPAIGITFGGFDYATLEDSLTADGYYSFTLTPDVASVSPRFRVS